MQISDPGAEDRKTLRERVSKLEERLDALQNISNCGDLSSNTIGNHRDSFSAGQDKLRLLEEDDIALDAANHVAPLIAILQHSSVGTHFSFKHSNSVLTSERCTH